MKLSLKMASRSVRDNWRHSLSALCAIAFGFCGIALVQGFMQECEYQFQDAYEKKNMYGQIIVEANANKKRKAYMQGDLLDKSMTVLQRFAAETDALIRFMPVEGIVATRSSSLNFFGYAYDVAEGARVRGERWSWDALYGRPLGQSGKSEFLVGRGLAELLGCDFNGQDIQYLPDGRFKPNDKSLDCMKDNLQLSALTLKGQVNAWDASISGIVDAGLRDWDDSWLLMPIEDAQTLFGGIRLSMIGVHLKDRADSEAVASRLQKAFTDEGLAVNARPWQMHPLAETYHSNMDLLAVLRALILIIVISVSTLAMLNTITRSILERTREIGSLRAIGYKRWFIVELFGAEGFLIGLLGSLAGLALALLIAGIINHSGILYNTPFSTAPVPFRIVLEPLPLAMIAGILSLSAATVATLAARFRTRQSIAEALIS